MHAHICLPSVIDSDLLAVPKQQDVHVLCMLTGAFIFAIPSLSQLPHTTHLYQCTLKQAHTRKPYQCVPLERAVLAPAHS